MSIAGLAVGVNVAALTGQGSLPVGGSTAVSLLDRLLHHNNVVATDGESYRMGEARSRSGGHPTKR